MSRSASSAIALRWRRHRQIGFTTDQRIEVITEPGQLIIRIAPATEGAA
ncbi:SymE family type I addiction module toxin [Serratia sp. NA_112.1]